MKCKTKIIISFTLCLCAYAFANEVEKQCECESFTLDRSKKINGRDYYRSTNHIFWWSTIEEIINVHSYAPSGSLTPINGVRESFNCISSYGNWTILWEGDDVVSKCSTENIKCSAMKGEKDNKQFKGNNKHM